MQLLCHEVDMDRLHAMPRPDPPPLQIEQRLVRLAPLTARHAAIRGVFGNPAPNTFGRMASRRALWRRLISLQSQELAEMPQAAGLKQDQETGNQNGTDDEGV